MRKELGKMEDLRDRFTGIFVRYGAKTNWKGFPVKTILLRDIRYRGNGNTITDHLWFNFTKGFERLGELKDGDTISFQARVKTYYKGYVNNREFVDERQLDYKLSHPTKIEKVI